MGRHHSDLVWSVLAVFVGGSVGSFVRLALSALQPADVTWPWITMLINCTGAALLGCLLEYVGATGEDAGVRRLWRLALGTGVIGGYTTYSTFILESDTRLIHHAVVVALAYLVASVLAGLLCAGLGIAAGSHLALRSKSRRGPHDSLSEGRVD